MDVADKKRMVGVELRFYHFVEQTAKLGLKEIAVRSKLQETGILNFEIPRMGFHRP